MKKGETIMELFFNEPTRQWHFEEVMKTVRISRPQAAYWLKRLIKEGLVKRTKPKGKMPYYLACYGDPNYQTKKRLFALQYLEKAGFLQHLSSLPNARVVILFGSLGRWDWYTKSDIDLFIYGDVEGFDQGVFRKKLHREMELFVYKDKSELKRINPSLLRNILEGYLIKGTLDFVKVEVNA